MPGVFPELRADLVERSRLLTLLSAWRSYGIVKVQAPAGFGKTTLASMWLHRLHESEPEPPTVAWVSLDEQHTTANSFLSHLHHSLAPSHESLQQPFTLLQAGQISAERYLDAVADACDEYDAHTIIVIDDAHFLHEQPALDALQALVDRSASHLHTVLLSRTPPAIDLLRPTLDGRVLTIQAADLSFDSNEFDALASASRLSEIDAAQRRRIAERSHGWIAGLQLLIHALPHSEPLIERAVLAVPSREEIAGYLEREMLLQLPDALLSLLTRTSFLPFLHAELCAAVTGLPIAQCAQLLNDAVAATGFVDRTTTVDSTGQRSHYTVYRMHSLLRDFLMERLRDIVPAQEMRTLRAEAARWLADHDQIEVALNLLFAAQDATGPDPDDMAFAADVLESACATALRRADVGFVVRWLERLPEALLAARPRLALDAAWADFHTLQPRLRVRLDVARRAIASAGRSGASATEFTAEFAVLHALCAAFEGDIDETERALRIADAVHDGQLPIPRGYLHLLHAYHFGARRVSADDRQHEVRRSIQAFRDGSFLRGQVEAFTLAGVIATYGLDGSDVVDLYRTGIDFIRNVGWEQSTYGINTHLYIGDALYMRSRIGEARLHFERVIDLAVEAGTEASTVYFANLYLQLCDLAEHASLAQHFDWERDFHEWETIRRFAAPRLWHSVAYMRMLRNLQLGRTDRCIPDLAALQLLPEQVRADAVPVSVLTSVAGAFFAGEHIAAAADLLQRFCTRMDAIDYSSMALRGRILQVLHLQIIGNDEAALRMLPQLLPVIERAELRRALIDITPLKPLLRRCSSAIARRYLALDVGRAPQHAARPFDLSTQEIAVLRRLKAFENTRALAADMSISYATVRTHLRNCFRKMNVHSRIAALEAAREAGLLE